MTVTTQANPLPAEIKSIQPGDEMYQLVTRLYPICRSITGNGVRQTLQILQEYISLDIREVPTGIQVFDWTVPKEWNIREAWIKDPTGKVIVNFSDHNLHVLNYSTPVHKIISLEELKPHLFSLPDKPDWIPYRTSYYSENWGFCLTHNQLVSLPDGDYEVYIDSSLSEGSLTYGEYFIPGETDDEVLISCHICHPSLANDNLSGISLAVRLAQWLLTQPRRYSYRFVFVPGTIGSITWLSINEEQAFQIKHGLVATLVGDSGKFTYKKSRRGDAEIDRAVAHALKHSESPYQIIDFFPYGYDERQYCSPGFNLAVGCLMRTPHGQYPEYHTSADNLDLVTPKNLTESYQLYETIIQILEGNRIYVNQNPKCEPQLGKRGLYRAISGDNHTKSYEMAMLWVLNFSDGEHSLLDIAERAGIPFAFVQKVAVLLEEHGLLKSN
jgi:aminopeptidase-like protein